MATITKAKVRDFIWKLIIYRFDLSQAIIIENRCQFDNPKFTKFCKELGISHRLTSVVHPQSNGEAELTNRILLQGLKARLGQVKRLWVEEPYHVLWVYRTT